MMHKLVFLVLVTCLFGPTFVFAQKSVETILPIDGHIAANGNAIELNWFDADPPRIGAVTVKRRKLGQTGGASWQTISPTMGPVMRFSDRTVRPGFAYEYQVLRTARDIVDVGYWIAGTDIPARDMRGTVHLVIDETVVEDLVTRLARFERDLVGDGWQVLRHIAPRGKRGHSPAQTKMAMEIRNDLHEGYMADPFGSHVVILIGHVPVVFSGLANPDGHGRVSHATDLFYAEMDGQWAVDRDGLLMHNQVPSDHIEMQVGRIDFSSISGNNRNLELHLLRAYFDKNHHWRMKLLGDLRTAYGQTGHLAVERAALRNVVGLNSAIKGGHHGVGEEKPWLWGVDFGDYKGSQYAKKYAIKAVFAMNFGSGKQRFERNNNAMVSLLAQPWYTVAVGWGARPAWWLHHMALGGTIGDVHTRTVNNGAAAEPYRDSMDYFPTGAYLWRNPIWVNLMGDPTLRAFPLAPPSNVAVRTSNRGVKLTWAASNDPGVIGYKVYRAPMGQNTFMPLNDDDFVTGLEFIDTAAEADARYMVRAYGLKDVYAGSFYTLSQGAFSGTSALSEIGFRQSLEINTTQGKTVTMPEEFSRVTDGKIFAFVKGPSIGRLKHDGKDWVYTPPVGYSGTVEFHFSVSDAWQTSEGSLAIKIE